MMGINLGGLPVAGQGVGGHHRHGRRLGGRAPLRPGSGTL
jgi:hypothetical protein